MEGLVCVGDEMHKISERLGTLCLWHPPACENSLKVDYGCNEAIAFGTLLAVPNRVVGLSA